MSNKVRFKVIAQGRVQGVGFRPFVYQLANRYDLVGFVMNTPEGVHIEIEGEEKTCDQFLISLQDELCQPGQIDLLTKSKLDTTKDNKFSILKSSNDGIFNMNISPDLAICADCLEEIMSPGERRYLYPFTNCMRCGPRYSILENLPYDRKNTTMKNFDMCDSCANEYQDPHNRRFHAQPIACQQCGPKIYLIDSRNQIISSKSMAIKDVVLNLKLGKIIAIKGVGGFHLIVDASNSEAIKELRSRKRRPTKSLAIMFESLDQIAEHCALNPKEKEFLVSPAAPIVLLQKNSKKNLPTEIAPNSDEWGCILPYTGLHYLLLKEFGKPIVITSANEDSEPMVYDNDDAINRLSKVADLFLMHDREISNPIDDSVLRVVHNSPMMIRKARGYTPNSMLIKNSSAESTSCTLAAGSYLKNTFVIATGNRLFQSQHNGDMFGSLSRQTIGKNIEKYLKLLNATPDNILLDFNRDFTLQNLGSKFIDEISNRSTIKQIYHHEAHIFSVVAEHSLKPPILGFAWDGVGFGPNDELRGGEIFSIQCSKVDHVASLFPIPLLGADKSALQPARVALGLLWTIYGNEIWEWDGLFKQIFSLKELSLFRMMFSNRQFQISSSMGRLFDGISSLLNFCHLNTYEGEAAQILQSAMRHNPSCQPHSTKIEGFEMIIKDNSIQLDWRKLVKCIFDLYRNGSDPRLLSYAFHEHLILLISTCSKYFGSKQVVLSGGCFQNRFLIEKAVEALKNNGYEVYWNQTTPTNDGGISLGQWARNVFSHTR